MSGTVAYSQAVMARRYRLVGASSGGRRSVVRVLPAAVGHRSARGPCQFQEGLERQVGHHLAPVNDLGEPPEQAPALPLRQAPPDPEDDVVVEGVDQARAPDGAALAQLSGR